MAKTIIWIDDDTAIIDPLVRPLESEGYTFRRINSVSEALEDLESFNKADLILLDMILPPGIASLPSEYRYPGLYILEMIKKNNITRPVVILSVITESKIRSELKDTGLVIRKILRKPIRPSKLKQELEAILEN